MQADAGQGGRRKDRVTAVNVDLSNCDKKLIHKPGLNQPHDVMVVLRPADLAPAHSFPTRRPGGKTSHDDIRGASKAARRSSTVSRLSFENGLVQPAGRTEGAAVG
jgi:hypothetical protein